MSNEAKLELDGKVYSLPTLTGSENEKAVDVSALRANTGYITIDDGYGNTGSCVSKITFIDGDQGILRYRGIPIEELAKESNFIETAYLIIYGELPNAVQLKKFSDLRAVDYQAAMKTIRPLLSSANRIDEVRLAKELGNRVREQYREAERLAKEGK